MECLPDSIHPNEPRFSHPLFVFKTIKRQRVKRTGRRGRRTTEEGAGAEGDLAEGQEAGGTPPSHSAGCVDNVCSPSSGVVEILLLWFPRCGSSADPPSPWGLRKQLQAGIKLICLLLSKAFPPCCQQERDTAEPGWCQSQGPGKAPPAGGAQVTHREGRKAYGSEVIKEENNPSELQRVLETSFQICFFLPLKVTVGPNPLPRRENRGTSRQPARPQTLVPGWTQVTAG